MEDGKTIYLLTEKNHSKRVERLINKYGYKLAKFKIIHKTNDEHTKYS